MKTFREFILESSCAGTPRGVNCPVHGSAKCPKMKSHKTIDQISRKHHIDTSFIEKQLKLGISIEKEHTKDKFLATNIALQHLDEIPDYYTRLKKMESSIKKDHKKFKKLKEENTSDGCLNYEWNSPIHDELERYCPGCQKNEKKDQCKYGIKFWDLYSYPTKLTKVFEESKSGDEGLHDWFNKSKSSDGTKGWVQLGGKWAGKPCARQPGQTSTPKCGSSKMAANLSANEEEAARKRKNRQDPNQPQKTGGAKPTNVRTEETILYEVKDKSGKSSGKKDACYHKVKSRYKVWPSAYASGSLVKCRKVGADNWGTKSEGYTRIQSRGSTYSIMLIWRGKLHTTQMFFPQFARPSKQQVTYEIRKVYPGAIVLSFNPSIKDPTKPLLFTGNENESRRY